MKRERLRSLSPILLHLLFNGVLTVTTAHNNNSSDDFFSLYFQYTQQGEVPAFFHRWSAIVGLGSFLGRSVCVNHGHFSLYPNIYCMLIGSPGTRKSTAIKVMKGLLQKAGYTTIAADKTSKEKFLLDLAGEDSGSMLPEKEISLDTLNLFGEFADETDKEMLIAADEFNDFMGLGNHDFISLLGNLWDFNGVYRSRIKNGKSVSVYNPTVSILGGNTPTGFALAFPTDILGQGFFSRLLLVYGEPNGKKVAFPKAPCPYLAGELVERLVATKTKCVGAMEIEPSAQKLLEKIYTAWGGIDDVRFDTYSNRRFTHLLKLLLPITAARLGKKITEADVVYANTILTHTEHLMPKALGEFGKAKHSDTVHKVIQILESADLPLGLTDLWKYVMQDLEKLSDLADILKNLTVADKVQTVNGKFLCKRKVIVEVTDDMVDYGLLRKEEIGAD